MFDFNQVINGAIYIQFNLLASFTQMRITLAT